MEKSRPPPRCPEAAAAAALEAGLMDEEDELQAGLGEPPSEANLTSLPVEIHALILSFLDPMDVLNYAQVCRWVYFKLANLVIVASSPQLKLIFQGHCKGQ